MPAHPYKIVLPGRAPRVPLIAHIPHSQTLIGPRQRKQILLSDDELQRELVRMTDWHTDHLFSWVLDLGGTLFVYLLSRLVMDPERFADDAKEPMAAVGQGVVYTHTSDGRALATITPAERAERIAELYTPYHEGLTALCRHILRDEPWLYLLDCHSVASTPLPHEPDQSPDRPDICIGTDEYHTSQKLADRLQQEFAAEGFRVAQNTPFEGTFVPTPFLHTEPRINSIMIEVRRGLYCSEETGERLPEFDEVRAALHRAVARALELYARKVYCAYNLWRCRR
jgi:N-formylglutamate amidohydrolase